MGEGVDDVGTGHVFSGFIGGFIGCSERSLPVIGQEKVGLRGEDGVGKFRGQLPRLAVSGVTRVGVVACCALTVLPCEDAGGQKVEHIGLAAVYMCGRQACIAFKPKGTVAPFHVGSMGVSR